jgi:hypothetical protein
VAAVTAAVERPPIGWASDPAAHTAVPALPPAGLSIPSIKARVSAQADPAPGQPVTVRLVVKAQPGDKGQPVPVTLSVFSTTFNPLSRALPPPSLAAKMDALVPVDASGDGDVTEELPLTWAAAPPPATATTAAPAPGDRAAPKRARAVTVYYMVLSSSLGGQSAPANLQTVAAARR